MILGPVQNAKHNHDLTIDSKEQLVRKPSRQRTTEAAIVKRENFRVRFQSQQSRRYRREKVIAQAGATFFIPIVRPLEIFLSSRTNGDSPFHRLDSRIR